MHEKLLAYTIAGAMDKHDRCRLLVETLATRMDIDARSAQRHLKRLLGNEPPLFTRRLRWKQSSEFTLVRYPELYVEARDRSQDTLLRADVVDMGETGPVVWQQILERVRPSFEDGRERTYFDGAKPVLTGNRLVVETPFHKKLSTLYAEPIAKAIEELRPGASVKICEPVDAVVAQMPARKRA